MTDRQPEHANGTERERALTFLDGQTEKYGRTGKAAELALADLCQILMCLNEFVYID